MTDNILHSAESVQWGTPEDIVARERACMGSIDFDPCSELEFNAVIRATRYLSLEERGEDALVLPWEMPGGSAPNSLNVHENPPGRLVIPFWQKTLVEPAVKQCVWIGFALGQLALLADERAHPTDFSMCYVRTRIPFIPHSSSRCKKCKGAGLDCPSCKGTGKVRGDRPSHYNYICGLNVDPDRFEQAFKDIGKIQHGPLARRFGQ